MDKETLATLFAHNFWANQRILDTCEHLSADELTRPVVPDPGWRTLRGILVHMLDTEYGWRSVLQGDDASQILAEEDFADVAMLRVRWQIEAVAWETYLAGMDAAHLCSRYNDEVNGLTIEQTMLHVIVHSVQHRSEAAAILTGYGHSPGDLDFDGFLKEKRHPNQ